MFPLGDLNSQVRLYVPICANVYIYLLSSNGMVVMCNTFPMSVSYNTALSGYAKFICCAHVPFIYIDRKYQILDVLHVLTMYLVVLINNRYMPSYVAVAN